MPRKVTVQDSRNGQRSMASNTALTADLPSEPRARGGRVLILEGCVDSYATFAGNHLVVNGWFYHPGADLESIELSVGSKRLKMTDTCVLRGSRPDVANHFRNGEETQWGFVLVTTLPAMPEGPLMLRVACGGLTKELPFGAEPVSLEVLRLGMQSFTTAQRSAVEAAILGRVGVSAVDVASYGAVPQEELQSFVRLYVEHAEVSAYAGVYFHGWLLDPENSLVSLHVRAGHATSSDILARMSRFPRSDVDAAFPDHARPGKSAGALAYVPMPVPEDTEQLEFVLVTRESETAIYTTSVSPVPATPLERTKAMLANFHPGDSRSFQLLENDIGPALEAAWARHMPAETSVEVYEFGSSPASLKRSVVVPLYGRYDFIFYQLSHFSTDPDFADTELIYVVDDPSITHSVTRLCLDTYPVFRLPFRVVAVAENLGYAGANNLGAKYAAGDMLILLNSDVLPKRPQWLSRLERWYRDLDEAGAIAPRLLFHDETVQHDGISFYHHPRYPGLWLNDHPGKGLPVWMAPPAHAAAVPAVTGAALMIDRHLYEELGGLDEGYILGDFEDSDLCLKAAEAGRTNYVIRDEELYHLERQSQALLHDQGWRTKLTLYNAWRHGRRWGSIIEKIADNATGES